MEKENKKERLNEKKKYVKTIKELVECCKRRDPRWRVIQEAASTRVVEEIKPTEAPMQINRKKKKVKNASAYARGQRDSDDEDNDVDVDDDNSSKAEE